MISGVFVDRPRLAIVIAIVITLAGALALLRIPVAQFPDIVPPQVSVHGHATPAPRRRWWRRRSAQIDRERGQRRREHDLHELQQRQ